MPASTQYVQQIIDTYRQATEANLQTPGREENVVVLTPELAGEVMITGDLHGHRRNFNLIRKTAALAQNPRRHLILQEVCHGGATYPSSTGCMSHTLLEDVAKLKAQFPRQVHFILANHELAEMTDYPIQKNRQMLNLAFRIGLQHTYGQATELVREAYIAFLRSCPLAVRLPGGVFVSHSIPERCDSRRFDVGVFNRPIEPAGYLERTPVFDLVWGRDYRQDNAAAFASLMHAKVLINGHEPSLDGLSTPNQLQVILDCCSGKGAYILMPTDRNWTQAEVLEHVHKLP